MNTNDHHHHHHHFAPNRHHHPHHHHLNHDQSMLEVIHSRSHSNASPIPMVHRHHNNNTHHHHLRMTHHNANGSSLRPDDIPPSRHGKTRATTELYAKSKTFLQVNGSNNNNNINNNNSSMKSPNRTGERSSSSSSKQSCHIFHAFSRWFRFCSKPKDYSDGHKGGGEMDEGLPFELTEPSEILSVNDVNLLSQRLPPIAIGNSWKLTFSTTKDGFCLKSLYRKMSMCSMDSPVLIIIQDTKNRVFGVLASNALKISDHFYGSSQSFLFRCTPSFQVYKWNGDNFYFIKGNPDSVIFGSGNGKYGLWLDGDLNKGRTQSCSTFGSPPLVPEEDFIIKTLECWTFGKT